MYTYTDTGAIYSRDYVREKTSQPQTQGDYDLDALKEFLRKYDCPYIDDISDAAIMNGAAQIQQGRAFGYAEYEIIDLTLGVLPSSIMARLILEFFDEGATEISTSIH